jgi:hypothetical protein
MKCFLSYIARLICARKTGIIVVLIMEMESEEDRTPLFACLLEVRVATDDSTLGDLRFEPRNLQCRSHLNITHPLST